MEYVQPVGAAADASYINVNPGGGVEGSAVPAEPIEHPQREIVEVIEFAGLEPSGADLTQLRQAIQQMIADAIPTIVQPYELIVACSDEVTPLEAGASKVTFRWPADVTLNAGALGVKASLTTAQATSGAGGIITIDINVGGASRLSTKLTIDNTENTSATAAAAAVISNVDFAADAEVTIDLDQIGDGTATGLKVTFMGVRA